MPSMTECLIQCWLSILTWSKTVRPGATSTKTFQSLSGQPQWRACPPDWQSITAEPPRNWSNSLTKRARKRLQKWQAERTNHLTHFAVEVFNKSRGIQSFNRRVEKVCVKRMESTVGLARLRRQNYTSRHCSQQSSVLQMKSKANTQRYSDTQGLGKKAHFTQWIKRPMSKIKRGLSEKLQS